MNKLEEQLDHLNYQSELGKAKQRRVRASGNTENGYVFANVSQKILLIIQLANFLRELLSYLLG